MTEHRAALAPVESELSTVDLALFILFLVASLVIGVFTAVRNRYNQSTNDYLLGSRNMPPVVVALSLVGTLISSISVLGNATEVYLYGTQLCVNLLGVILGIIVVHQMLLPIFHNLGIISINKYLALRYKSAAVYKTGSVCTILNKFFYMGICLYTPSLAISTMTNLSLWTSSISLGLVCIFYTALGGMKAVVYTDVMQVLVMISGVLMMVVVSCIDVGGVARVWTIADQGSRIQFFNLDPSPFVRHTFWSTSVFGFYFAISIMYINQEMFQRFASVSSLASAQWICVAFVIGLWAIFVLCYFSGLVAYAVYRNCDPITSGRIQKPDQIIPYLVMDKLAYIPGLPGVFVAAVSSSVLSTLSSNANSMACLIWEDLLRSQSYFSSMTNASATNCLRLLSVVAGLSGIAISFLIGQLGDIFNVTYSISTSITGPIIGLFLAGIFTPWVNSKGAMAGMLTALSYNLLIVVGKFVLDKSSPPRLLLSTHSCPENLLNLTDTFSPDDILAYPESSVPPLTPVPSTNRVGVGGMYDVSYCYNGMIGILITLVVGSLISLCTGPLGPEELDKALVSPSSARLHRWLWGLGRGRHQAARVKVELQKTKGAAEQVLGRPNIGFQNSEELP